MFQRLMLVGLLGSICAMAQPRLRATDPVVNGASYAVGIAQGSIFVVVGSNLSGANIVTATRFPLETTMNGSSIRFTPVTGGAPIDAFMIYTTQHQVAGLLPSTAAAGDYNVTVTYSGQTTAPARVPVLQRNVGVFTANSAGYGQAQALNRGELELNRPAAGQLAQFRTMPAAPGMRVDLYGTGVGPDAASDSTGGSSGNQAAANVRVRVGSREVAAAYAGRSQGVAGLDQIVFILPNDVETGCSVPAEVVYATGRSSNSFSLAIAGPGQQNCTHPFLSQDALKKVSEGGTLAIGAFNLAKQTIGITVPGIPIALEIGAELIGGSFARYGVGEIGAVTDTQPVSGQCIVVRRRGGQNDLLVPAGSAVGLDAGASLVLNGPNANNIDVPRDAQTKSYEKTLATTGLPGGGNPVITQGTYTLRGNGGPDVGAFSAQATLPQPLNWTNRTSINEVNRSQNLNVTWTGGGSDMVGVVGIAGSRVGGTEANPIYDAAVFICYGNASAGSLTVPAAVLGRMPAVTGDIETGSLGLLGVQTTGPPTAGTFSAPLTAGGSTDYAQFNYLIGTLKTLPYR